MWQHNTTLVFTIDDGNIVKMIVPNLDFGTVLPSWEVGGDAFNGEQLFFDGANSKQMSRL